MSRFITKRHIAITSPHFIMAMTFLIARVNSLEEYSLGELL